MPPKIRITRKEIIDTTVELVRQKGTDSINARAVAAALGCSTQPVFSNFATMDELHTEVIASALDRYLGFIEREIQIGKYPEYKASGMAYIRFAKEETELFKLLFMCNRQGQELQPTTDFEASIEIIMKNNNITRESATLMHLEMWTCVHGIATMIATSFLELDQDLISNMLSDIYLGVRKMHITEENTK